MSKVVQVKGKLATKPVIISLDTRNVILILIETQKGLERFCYILDKVQALPDYELAKRIARSTASEIVLSDVGDDIELMVQSKDDIEPTPHVITFDNKTKKLL